MTYHLPTYLVAIPFAIAFCCLVLIVLLFTVWRSVFLLSFVPLIIGLFAGGVFGPMMAMDQVKIDHLRIQQKTGFWFDPTIKGFDFDGLQFIEIRRQKSKHGIAADIWIGHYEGDRHLEVDPGDLWAINEESIAEELRKREIKVRR